MSPKRIETNLIASDGMEMLLGPYSFSSVENFAKISSLKGQTQVDEETALLLVSSLFLAP